MEILTNTMIALSRGIPGLVVAGMALILMFLALIRKDSGLMIFAAFLSIPFAYARRMVRVLDCSCGYCRFSALGSAFAIGKDDPIFAWVTVQCRLLAYMIYILFRFLSLADFGSNDIVGEGNDIHTDQTDTLSR